MLSAPDKKTAPSPMRAKGRVPLPWCHLSSRLAAAGGPLVCCIGRSRAALPGLAANVPAALLRRTLERHSAATAVGAFSLGPPSLPARAGLLFSINVDV